MNENSTSTQAHLPLAERARQGLLLAEPELPVEELPLLEHPTDKEARRRFAYAVRAAMDYGDLAIVLKPVEMACYEQHEMQRVQVSRRIQVSRRACYEQHEMQRVQVSWDAPVRERPAQGTRKLITWTETRRYFNREAYRAWRLTCPPELLSPLSQIGKWLGATPALSESIPPETSLAELPGPARLTEAQQDKADCQKIASSLWAEQPDATQAAILENSRIKPYLKKWPGKNTLPGWLSEIDPRPKEQRRGRPKVR
jgi:asparagine synthetase B (glutamine-hydrolysing)